MMLLNTQVWESTRATRQACARHPSAQKRPGQTPNHDAPAYLSSMSLPSGCRNKSIFSCEGPPELIS